MQRITTKRAAQQYLDTLAGMSNAEPCVYGHFGCAITEGGPCSDEVTGEWLSDDPDTAEVNHD